MPDPHERTTTTVAAGAAVGEAAGAGLVSVAAADRALSTRQLAWRRFKRHRLAMGSSVVLVVIAVAAIVIPFFWKYNYHQTFTAGEIIRAPFPHSGPSLKHLFGVDEIGRDYFIRVIYGGRVSLEVGLGVALSAGVIGAFVGSIAGYY